jgi:hypothetical protein
VGFDATALRSTRAEQTLNMLTATTTTKKHRTPARVFSSSSASSSNCVNRCLIKCVRVYGTVIKERHFRSQMSGEAASENIGIVVTADQQQIDDRSWWQRSSCGAGRDLLVM